VPDAFVILFAAILGALVGSFLNVVLWRVPRGESVVSPSSHCPNCGTFLRPQELIPIVSWVALRGRCRTCGVHISARYPLVELACALVLALVAWLVV
jgi:leader peptidase (prepilin peptidase)/N-methyltransferase